MNLRTRICTIHPAREAAVRCPGCSKYYCRECVTEHDGRMMCATCLDQSSHITHRSRRSASLIVLFTGACLGWVLIWLVFYALGSLVWNIPTSYHQNPVMYPSGAPDET